MLLLNNPRAHLAIAVFAATMAGSSAPAAAQGRRSECTVYAREAVEQYQQSVRLGCDFEGARWSDQREAHFAWCLISPRGVVEESRIRHRMLFDCAARHGGNGGTRPRPRIRRAPEGRYASCDTYAKVASVQAEAARKFRCDLRGPEWSVEASLHYHWCMRNTRQTVMNRLLYRTEELQKCFGRLSNLDRR